MASSTPEEVLNALLTQVQQLTAEVHELRNTKNREQRVTMDVEDVDAEDDDEGANQAEAGWLAVLGQPQKTPSSHAAVVFGKMLQSPPPLSVVQETVRKVTRYVDTPVTPAARNHRPLQSCRKNWKRV